MATNQYYQRAFNALAGTLARARQMVNEFALIQRGFDLIGTVTGATKYQLSCSNLENDLETGLDVAYFRVQRAITLYQVRASLIESSASGVVEIDITVNGAPMLSTPLTIDALELTSLTAAAPVVLLVTALPDDADVRISVVQAGSGARGLIVALVGSIGT